MESGDAEVDGGSAFAGVELGQLVFGRGEADVELFGFAEPASFFSLADPVGEVVSDLIQSPPFAGINSEEWTANAGVLMVTVGSIGAPAVAKRDLGVLVRNVPPAAR